MIVGGRLCDEKWLGWQDSNLRMAIPKTAALPLGYTPVGEVKIINNKTNFNPCLHQFTYFFKKTMIFYSEFC